MALGIALKLQLFFFRANSVDASGPKSFVNGHMRSLTGGKYARLIRHSALKSANSGQKDESTSNRRSLSPRTKKALGLGMMTGVATDYFFAEQRKQKLKKAHDDQEKSTHITSHKSSITDPGIISLINSQHRLTQGMSPDQGPKKLVYRDIRGPFSSATTEDFLYTVSSDPISHSSRDILNIAFLTDKAVGNAGLIDPQHWTNKVLQSLQQTKQRNLMELNHDSIETDYLSGDKFVGWHANFPNAFSADFVPYSNDFSFSQYAGGANNFRFHTECKALKDYWAHWPRGCRSIPERKLSQSKSSDFHTSASGYGSKMGLINAFLSRASSDSKPLKTKVVKSDWYKDPALLQNHCPALELVASHWSSPHFGGYAILGADWASNEMPLTVPSLADFLIPQRRKAVIKEADDETGSNLNKNINILPNHLDFAVVALGDNDFEAMEAREYRRPDVTEANLKQAEKLVNLELAHNLSWLIKGLRGYERSAMEPKIVVILPKKADKEVVTTELKEAARDASEGLNLSNVVVVGGDFAGDSEKIAGLVKYWEEERMETSEE